MKRLLVLGLVALGSAVPVAHAESVSTSAQVAPAASAQARYPAVAARIPSPGRTTYFVDPARGDDAKSGTDAKTPWKSLVRVNALRLAPGDRVVIAPGRHEETLMPYGEGTVKEPIEIRFLPGVHEFGVELALRLPIFVSNACDDPKTPKPVGILVQNARHLRFIGGGTGADGKTLILYAGRMVEVFNDHAEDITYSSLSFDLKRPTVSEYRVLETSGNSAVIQVAEGSDYAVENGKLTWKGDIGPGGEADQDSIPAEGRAWRIWGKHPLAGARAEDLGGRRVRLTYAKGTGGLIAGHQIQSRRHSRDSVGVHNSRSKDIVFRDCDFHALTNMGFVSQFTENITYSRVNVVPPPGTIRTCPAWADIFQFSNCRGDLLVENCRLSGMQDDAINCHGTHLKIVEKVSENQLHVRFAHSQTYGFTPYVPGDEVAVIDHASLDERPGNPRRKVTACAPMPGDTTGKEWLLTLDDPAPVFGKDDVVDNITWYPNLVARGNHISMDPVRGFLITTRGKALVEGNTFHRCAMPGILVEDDAAGWFESGPVRDLTIRDNRFIGCGILFNPASSVPGKPVHRNIRIQGNYFEDAEVGGHHVEDITVTGNRFSKEVRVRFTNSKNVKVEGNTANRKE